MRLWSWPRQVYCLAQATSAVEAQAPSCVPCWQQSTSTVSLRLLVGSAPTTRPSKRRRPRYRLAPRPNDILGNTRALHMARFLLVHFLGGVATVWGLITVLFLLFQVLPGDPVMAMIDPATASTMPESVLQERRREFGLHLPRWQQYLTYLTRVAQGDLGRSWETREPVARIIGRRLPHTIALATGGMLVAILLGIPTGLIAAAYRNSPLDYAITLFSVVWIASPNFWLALLILYAFAYRLGWFPIVSTGLEAGFLSM